MREHTSQGEPTTSLGEHIGINRHKIEEEEVKILARESNTCEGRSWRQWK